MPTTFETFLAPRDGLFCASRLTLRVALRAIAAAARRRRTVLSMSAVRISGDEPGNAVGVNWNFLKKWLPGTDYSALRASPLRGRPAGDRRRCAASSNRIVYVGGSNYDRTATEANQCYTEFFIWWLPGTDSNRRPTD
jgi:hypothetical protein